jgi:hypothetical protein
VEPVIALGRFVMGDAFGRGVAVDAVAEALAAGVGTVLDDVVEVLGALPQAARSSISTATESRSTFMPQSLPRQRSCALKC